MERTLIIGASGQIGKQVTQLMVNNGHVVNALVRDKTKLADIKADTLHIIEGDLEKDFSHAFTDCSNVIFVAGSGGNTGADKTLLIDLWAACKAADYAKAHKVKHFVMVSSIGADDPSQGSDKMQPYLVAKHMADEHLINSGLTYTILRPGTLTNDDALAGFTSERSQNKEDWVITRADVAQAIVYISTQIKPQNSTIIELFNGDKSLTQVVAA